MIDSNQARSWWVAIGACLLITLAGTSYVVSSVMGAHVTNTDSEDAKVAKALLQDPYLVVRSLRGGPKHGHAAIVPIDNPNGHRTVTGLRCERIAASRGTGTGVCLQQTGKMMDRFHAVIFDRRVRKTRELDLTGIPSRARVSRSARYVATTTFISGHSYTSAGFSTQTLLHDTDVSEAYNVEEFTFLLNGEPHRSADLNAWGVTFVPGEPRFFATVRSQGRTYLVDGNVEKQVMKALRVNAECPSLSPDGKHLVYKKRKLGEATDLWRFYVLDLATGEERKLGETRSIDDQVAWLDNRHILYGVPDRPGYTKKVDIWSAPIDGDEPHLFMEDAASPTAVR